ncbi:hypothetical protein JL720_7641 [Aureococcus anophagefferens]|nr:hypothetical protein JL720_7641 [Aureococcus anophagefferens]
MRRRVSSGARRREPEPPTYDAAAIQALFDTWADDVEGAPWAWTASWTSAARWRSTRRATCGCSRCSGGSARQPALILREWAEGMAAIGCDSLEKLKAYVEALEPHAGQDKRAKFPTSKAHISAVSTRFG